MVVWWVELLTWRTGGEVSGGKSRSSYTILLTTEMTQRRTKVWETRCKVESKTENLEKWTTNKDRKLRGKLDY